jgi:hypothetical protein
MASIEGFKIENGNVIGAVSTNSVGSECTFEVCTVEEWLELTEDAASELLVASANESGQYEIYPWHGHRSSRF